MDLEKLVGLGGMMGLSGEQLQTFIEGKDK